MQLDTYFPLLSGKRVGTVISSDRDEISELIDYLQLVLLMLMAVARLTIQLIAQILFRLIVKLNFWQVFRNLYGCCCICSWEYAFRAASDVNSISLTSTWYTFEICFQPQQMKSFPLGLKWISSINWCSKWMFEPDCKEDAKWSRWKYNPVSRRCKCWKLRKKRTINLKDAFPVHVKYLNNPEKSWRTSKHGKDFEQVVVTDYVKSLCEVEGGDKD